MKELSIEERKQVVKEILKYVHEVCEENDIRYFAGYGTALGAVRHHGFIPWDDDADIEVPWPDYRKLMKVINEKKDSHYRFMSFGENDYYYSYGKIVDTRTVCHAGARERQIEDIGVDIDVFPLVGIRKEELKSVYDRLQSLKKAGSNYANNRVKLRKNLLLYVQEKVMMKEIERKGINAWGQELEQLLDNYPFDGGDIIFSYGGIYKQRQLFDRSIYAGYELVDFEDFQVRVPVEWDSYLTGMYGDWRQPPKEEDRKPGHQSRKYWWRDQL